MSSKFCNLLLASILIATACSAAAQYLYKYKNHDGSVVISSTIPSDLVHQGYTVLDSKGQVAEVVSPTATSKQKIQLNHLENQRIKHAQRKEKDKELLSLYGSVDEIHAAMNRKQAELDLKIKELSNLQAITDKQIEHKQAQVDKAKKGALAHFEEELKSLIAQQQDYSGRTKGLMNEKQHLKTQYNAYADRFLKLRGHANEHLKLDRNDIEGKWRMRDDVAIDWIFNPDGSFSSFFQALGSHATEKNYGSWQLSGNQIILIINKKENTNTLGEKISKKVAQEKRVRIIHASKRQLQILLDGYERSLSHS